MTSLKAFLSAKDYIKIDLKSLASNHFAVQAKLNGVEGMFILDTGASSTCVSKERLDYFNMVESDRSIAAAGAGDSSMTGLFSDQNKLKIGKWKVKDLSIVSFDLSHVNEALKREGMDAVDGIIGADILIEAEGVIDYKKSRLFLKSNIYKKKRRQ